MHRIGRTGRAIVLGSALLFVTPRERHLLKSIRRHPLEAGRAELPTVDDVNEQRVAKFRDSITAALRAPGLELFRRMIGITSATATSRWRTSPPRWRCSRGTARVF